MYNSLIVTKQEFTMSTVKKGTLTASIERAKHLREMKQDYWKAERQAHKKLIQQELKQ